MSDLAIPSPRNRTCALDARAGICVGCGRSLDEIAEWGEAKPERQREILRALPKRMAARASRSPITGAPATF